MEVTKLTASDGMLISRFGFSVSISDNQILVRAFTHDDIGSNSGGAYFFNNN